MTDQNRANDIRIQTPCPKTWDMLEGGERTRFCSECSLHVHNSEALTREEASALVEEPSGRVCMRIVKDDSGAPLFLDSRTSATRGNGKLLRVARWALAAGTGLLAACRPEAPARVDTGTSGGATTGSPEAPVGVVCPVEELGDVAYPEELGEVEAPAQVGKVAIPGKVPIEALGEVVVQDPE